MSEFDRRLASLASTASSAASASDGAVLRARADRLRARRTAAAVVAAAIAVAGVGVAASAFSSRTGPAPLASPSPSMSPSLSASPSPSAAASLSGAPSTSPSTQAPPVGPCRAEDVSLVWGPEASGSTHRGAAVILTYSGGGTCTLAGYPTVTARLPGAAVQTARHTKQGYLGGLTGEGIPSLVLSPTDRTASALVEALAFDQATTGSCGAYSSVSVTLPGDTTATELPPWSSDACSSLEVHPFVAGDTGRG